MDPLSSSVGERRGEIKRNRAEEDDVLDVVGGGSLLSLREVFFGTYSNDNRRIVVTTPVVGRCINERSNKNKKFKPTRMNNVDVPRERQRQRHEDHKPRKQPSSMTASDGASSSGGDPTMRSRRTTAKQRRGGRDRRRRQDASKQQQSSRDDEHPIIHHREERSMNGIGPDSNNASETKVDNAKKKSVVAACAAEDVLVRHILGRVGKDDEVVDLPKEMINELPDVPYRRTKNAVVVISNSYESERAVADIRRELSTYSAHRRRRRGHEDGIVDDDDDDTTPMKSYHYVGMDTETRPKFAKGGENHPPALLQIATESTAYLFRLTFRRGGCSSDDAMTNSLMKLLSDTSIIKVGIGIHNDVRELERVYGIETCGCGGSSSFLDLGKLVGLRWPNIRRAGLRNLTATVLGYRLSKAQQMKDWEMSRLTPAMVAYAAADAFVALDLLAAIVG